MRISAHLAAAAVAILILPAAADAGSLKVYPVRVVMTGLEPVQTMTIQSSGSETIRVQVRVFAWRQEKGEDVYDETRDILVNPPLFEIGAGGQQIARFGLRVPAAAIEKSYRVFLEEVPGQRPSQPGEVRTLLRIGIPIFVPPTEARGQLAWTIWPTRPNAVTLTIRNQGTVHVQIHRLALARAGGASLATQDMSFYLLPGASRQVTLNVNAPVRAGDALKLSAVTDQADFSADLTSETPPSENGPH
jgi:fimbrial chaperone protein